jgi:hypothetical protein
MTCTINKETPIAMLNVGQLMELLNSEKKQETVSIPETSKRLVYGLRGIRNLFGVSHATAQRYKDTIIRDAVSQNGRKIIVDAEYAMELFKNSKSGRAR